MQVILLPMGTPGDVQPFMEIGCRLRDRGHDPLLLAHDTFADWANRLGIPFASIGSRTDYARLLADSNLWHPLKGPKVFAKRLVAPTLQPTYEHIASVHQQNPDVIVLAQTMAFGARIAQDALGVRTVTVHRQPAILRGLDEPPNVPMPLRPATLPRILRGPQYRLADWWIDRYYAPPVNALRSKLRLSEVRRLANSWIHSPLKVIGLWPSWFSDMQEGWPAIDLVGFDLQTSGEVPMAAELIRFLDAGPPPILFTMGSGMAHAGEFYETAARVVRQLKQRAIFVTRFIDQLPADLDSDILPMQYAPFDQLLPRTAVVVHHGGIGTVAQSLAAGTPQLGVPGIVFDTPDNALRIKQLGAGRLLSIHEFDPLHAAETLNILLHDESVRLRCNALAAQTRTQDGALETVKVLEQLG